MSQDLPPVRSDDGGDVVARLTARIVIAYIRGNQARIARSDLARVIGGVRLALGEAICPPPPPPAPAPPDPVEYPSPTAATILCLACGRKRVTLRRHLAEAHGLTPFDYRVRFHLPDDFPMEAPSYRKARSERAREFGLGKTVVPEKPVPGMDSGTRRSGADASPPRD